MTPPKIGGHISTLQMTGTMTMNDDWIDGSEATFAQFFRGDDKLPDASNWLISTGLEQFPFKSLFLFLSDTALQPNNRVTRYRKISKRINISNFIKKSGGLIEEGCEEFLQGLLFWSIIRVDPLKLTSIIDYLRSDRGSFLFFSRVTPKYTGCLNSILRCRGMGRSLSIDHRSLVTQLVHRGIIPIRVWGPSGDRDLWIEIYTRSLSFCATMPASNKIIR